MIKLGMKEQKLLDYMKKYAHAQYSVINEFSGDIQMSCVELLQEIESDYDCDDFQNYKGEILSINDFREYVFPERLLELYQEYLDEL